MARFLVIIAVVAMLVVAAHMVQGIGLPSMPGGDSAKGIMDMASGGGGLASITKLLPKGVSDKLNQAKEVLDKANSPMDSLKDAAGDLFGKTMDQAGGAQGIADSAMSKMGELFGDAAKKTEKKAGKAKKKLLKTADKVEAKVEEKKAAVAAAKQNVQAKVQQAAKAANDKVAQKQAAVQGKAAGVASKLSDRATTLKETAAAVSAQASEKSKMLSKDGRVGGTVAAAKDKLFAANVSPKDGVAVKAGTLKQEAAAAYVRAAKRKANR